MRASLPGIPSVLLTGTQISLGYEEQNSRLAFDRQVKSLEQAGAPSHAKLQCRYRIPRVFLYAFFAALPLCVKEKISHAKPRSRKVYAKKIQKKIHRFWKAPCVLRSRLQKR
jgi:hypothetical protein